MTIWDFKSIFQRLLVLWLHLVSAYPGSVLFPLLKGNLTFPTWINRDSNALFVNMYGNYFVFSQELRKSSAYHTLIFARGGIRFSDLSWPQTILSISFIFSYTLYQMLPGKYVDNYLLLCSLFHVRRIFCHFEGFIIFIFSHSHNNDYLLICLTDVWDDICWTIHCNDDGAVFYLFWFYVQWLLLKVIECIW